jgi:hypothetical protein
VSFIGKRRTKGYMSVRDQKPVARTDELVVEEVGEELLVYDETNECAHSLSPAAARVWRACDGEKTANRLGVELELDADTVTRALEELQECNLLDTGQPVTGMTRREATLKGVKVGAAAATAPLIYSILAPVPAMAATQVYCLALGCTQGCGACHQAGCACCGPGGNEDKICVQDCTSTFCNESIIKMQCTPTFQGNPPCNTSDARLKREIRPLTLDWLA